MGSQCFLNAASVPYLYMSNDFNILIKVQLELQPQAQFHKRFSFFFNFVVLEIEG